MQTARDLNCLAQTKKHDVQLTYARDGFVVSEELLPSLQSDPVYEVLSCLLEGGGSDLYWFEEIAAVEVHSVVLEPGCFMRHWGEEFPDACLALLSRIVKLREENDPGDGDLWVIVERFPHIPISHASHFNVSAADWDQCVADEGARVTTFVAFENLRFVLLDQHTMQGSYLFMPQ